jgi:hypothetical protein
MKALTVTVVALLTAFASASARADDAPVDAARQVFEKNQNAVVWVTAVMRMRAGGALGGMFGRQEQKVEGVGTVIHESGLTVMSYTQLDPTAMLNAAMAGAGGGGLGDEKIEFKSELSGVKIRLADGTEVPARLVLKDDDLDPAFVMPADTARQLPHLNFDARAGAPMVKALDPIVSLWRLPQSLDRQPAVAIGRVAAVVNKPRTFYVVSGIEAMGAPAFLPDGRPLGISVMRKQGMGSMSRGMFSMASASALSPVIVPAGDVMEVALQALAKKDEPPAAASDPAPAAEGADKPADLPPPAAKKPKAAPKN